MRPQDIVILLKIAAMPDDNWYLKDIASELSISPSEVSESIHRSKIAGLIDESGKKLRGMALLEFLVFGLKYVFPEKPGYRTRGIPTAHSAPPLDKIISSNDNYVWPSPEGNVSGYAIEPLYRTVPKSVSGDPKFYQLLALVDALRVGRARERKIAKEKLKDLIT